MTYHLAIDIGASSGRHILGHVEDGKIVTEEIWRFQNGASMKNGHLCWDLVMLYREILNGLRACRDAGKIPETMGIDTWGVDFVLLDRQGKPMGDAVAYRDSRTDGMQDYVRMHVPDEMLYERTGIQYQPFNTIYQLSAIRNSLSQAESLLMIPDYFNCRLTGIKRFEYTNATTTGLVDAAEKTWDVEILDRLGFPRSLFPELSMPGTVVGHFTEETQAEVGFDCTVVLPATHDTGSAFLAVPVRDSRSVILSSGTWSLLGVENSAPITTEESRRANFTNEGGYDYRFRYLRNIMGLWMIQELRREYGTEYSFDELIAMAEAADAVGTVDVGDQCFMAPPSMSEAVREWCRSHGQEVPETMGETLQCVYRSLALCYKDAVAELETLTGRTYTKIHVVGGGSNADYLNRLTARATGLPVLAGPAEATALGNLLVQMIAAEEFENLDAARNAVSVSFPVKEITP